MKKYILLLLFFTSLANAENTYNSQTKTLTLDNLVLIRPGTASGAENFSNVILQLTNPRLIGQGRVPSSTIKPYYNMYPTDNTIFVPSVKVDNATTAANVTVSVNKADFIYPGISTGPTVVSNGLCASSTISDPYRRQLVASLLNIGNFNQVVTILGCNPNRSSSVNNNGVPMYYPGDYDWGYGSLPYSGRSAYILRVTIDQFGIVRNVLYTPR